MGLLISVLEQWNHPMNDVNQPIPYKEMDQRIWMTFKATNGKTYGPIEIRLFNEEQPILAEKFADCCAPHSNMPVLGENKAVSFIGKRVSTLCTSLGLVKVGSDSNSDTDNEMDIYPSPLEKKLEVLESTGNRDKKSAIYQKFDIKRAGTLCLMRKVTDENKVTTQFCILIEPSDADNGTGGSLPGLYKDSIVIGRVENGLCILKDMLDRYGTMMGLPTTSIMNAEFSCVQLRQILKPEALE